MRSRKRESVIKDEGHEEEIEEQQERDDIKSVSRKHAVLRSTSETPLGKRRGIIFPWLLLLICSRCRRDCSPIIGDALRGPKIAEIEKRCAIFIKSVYFSILPFYLFSFLKKLDFFRLPPTSLLPLCYPKAQDGTLVVCEKIVEAKRFGSGVERGRSRDEPSGIEDGSGFREMLGTRGRDLDRGLYCS